ncbi:MAG: amidophosphoribosyltransferase [Planctomycetota bacterium]
MCGFIGMVAPRGTDVFADLYDGLTAIQHRGQDAAGIVTYDHRFNLKKGEGLVRDVFAEKHSRRLRGNLGVAHVRYPTVGAGGVEDAQPFTAACPYGIAMAHNGNLTNFAELKGELASNGLRHINSSCDVEAILNVFAEGMSRRGKLDPETVFDGVNEVYQRAKGAYSAVAIIAGYGLVAFRDPYGIKPIVFGERTAAAGRTFCVASESVVLDLLGCERTTDIQAGEAVLILESGEVIRRKIANRPHNPCLFEWVYFARPDSFLDGVSVYKSRLRLGERLADLWLETGLHADVVIPVPESSTTAAMALANKLGIKYREGLVKNRYIGRTFIMPNQTKRQRSVRQKLNPIPLEFEGKDVLLVDDSIVRGNTSRQIVKIARDAGARRVFFASYSPPIRYPCLYGIDMSTKNEFIARGRLAEEVAEEIGADYVLYQTLENLIEAVQEGNPNLKSFCAACFCGEYPTGDITPEVLRAIEQERTTSQCGAPQPIAVS